MRNMDNMEDSQFLFGTLLVAANKIDTLLERALSKYDITTKQWFLSVVLSSLFDSPPTIKEAAGEMGSSHQNVKQVALKLQEKGLVSLEKDKKDARATRIRLTEKSQDFWAQTGDEGRVFIDAVFKGIDKNELVAARSVITQVLNNLNNMDKSDTEIK